jgi:hypothetical protein
LFFKPIIGKFVFVFLLVFSVDSNGDVTEKGNDSIRHEPSGPTNSECKELLEGRASFIGDVIYIILDDYDKGRLTTDQLALLKKAKWNIINEVQFKIPDADIEKLASIRFIGTSGDDIDGL